MRQQGLTTLHEESDPSSVARRKLNSSIDAGIKNSLTDNRLIKVYFDWSQVPVAYIQEIEQYDPGLGEFEVWVRSIANDPEKLVTKGWTYFSQVYVPASYPSILWVTDPLTVGNAGYTAASNWVFVRDVKAGQHDYDFIFSGALKSGIAYDALEVSLHVTVHVIQKPIGE